MTHEQKRMLATLSCRLNDHPAKIVNTTGDFAKIVTIWEPYIEAEFSWQTVDRIMTRDGKFKT